MVTLITKERALFSVKLSNIVAKKGEDYVTLSHEWGT